MVSSCTALVRVTEGRPLQADSAPHRGTGSLRGAQVPFSPTQPKARCLVRDTISTTVPASSQPRPGISDVPALQGPLPGDSSSPQPLPRRKKRR